MDGKTNKHLATTDRHRGGTHQTERLQTLIWSVGWPDRHRGGDAPDGKTNKQVFQNLGGGWVGVLTENNATPWLHLASWNLPDSQLS